MYLLATRRVWGGQWHCHHRSSNVVRPIKSSLFTCQSRLKPWNLSKACALHRRTAKVRHLTRTAGRSDTVPTAVADRALWKVSEERVRRYSDTEAEVLGKTITIPPSGLRVLNATVCNVWLKQTSQQRQVSPCGRKRVIAWQAGGHVYSDRPRRDQQSTYTQHK